MSDLSNKKPAVTESLGGTAELGAQVQPKGKPVQIWAAFGAVILALHAVRVDQLDHRTVLRAGARRAEPIRRCT